MKPILALLLVWSVSTAHAETKPQQCWDCVERLAMAGIERREHAGEAQLLEFGAQLLLEFHVPPPKRCPNNSVAVRTKVRAGATTGTGSCAVPSKPWSSMRLIVT